MCDLCGETETVDDTGLCQYHLEQHMVAYDLWDQADQAYDDLDGGR